VLLLAGGGHADRDDNVKQLAINLFPPLVRAFDEWGIATFRYDKRGVGASGGSYWSTGFHDRLADAVAAVGWLADQRPVDASRIYVLGHSEGALLALRLAAGAAPIAGAVLLAGSAKSGEETLLWQGRQIAQTFTGFNAWLVRALHFDPLQRQRSYIARVKTTTGDTARIGLIQKVNARWMREFLAYDPAPDLAAVRVPVLALTGAKDLQVDPADIDRMAELVPHGFEGHVIPDVSHLLRLEPGPPSLRTYKQQVQRPIDGRVLEDFHVWLQQRIAGE
jgi:pimeloyl-ACP methyl ester carboxylesterase